MNFKNWLEQQEGNAEQAILSIVGGSDSDLGPQEKDHLLNRRTTEFGRDIIKQIKNLGIISAIGNDDPQKYSDIINSISHGITIKELIDKIEGEAPMDIPSPGQGYNADPKVQPQQFKNFF